MTTYSNELELLREERDNALYERDAARESLRQTQMALGRVLELVKDAHTPLTTALDLASQAPRMADTIGE